MATTIILLGVEGMTCDDCSYTVQQALEREDGVVEASVSWRSGWAAVTYDPDRTNEDEILANRVFRRQFRAQARPPPVDCC